MQGHAPDTAAAIFREARADAEAQKAPELAAQAQIALAAGLFAAKKTEEAALAYAEAGQLAAASGARMLAVEAYRMCGQLVAAQGDFPHAGQAFWRAIEIASDGEPEEWRLSSAPEAARALAALFRNHDRPETAECLERLAVEMETMGESEKDTPEVMAHAC